MKYLCCLLLLLVFLISCKAEQEEDLTGLSHESIVDLCYTAARMGYIYGEAGFSSEKLIEDLEGILSREEKGKEKD